MIGHVCKDCEKKFMPQYPGDKICEFCHDRNYEWMTAEARQKSAELSEQEEEDGQ